MSARLDRRRHVRIAPKGTVILVAEGYRQRGRIVNLAQGGLLVAVPIPGPEALLAQPVSVHLRLDGQDAAWLQASGHIVRVTDAGLAIAFEAAPAALLHVIEEMSAASRAHLRVLSVVLIDAEPGRRIAIAACFRTIGCAVDESATPLEAIVRLGESSFEPDVIAIADSMPAAVADELRGFVERSHPRAKLVTIEGAVPAPGGADPLLSLIYPAPDLVAQIRQILSRPSHARAS